MALRVKNVLPIEVFVLPMCYHLIKSVLPSFSKSSVLCWLQTYYATCHSTQPSWSHIVLPPTPCESRSPKYDVRKLWLQSFLTSFFVYSRSKNNVNNCIFPFYCTWSSPVQQQYINEKGGMFLLNPQLLSLLPAIIISVAG